MSRYRAGRLLGVGFLDVSRYNFGCQKSLHLSLQYAKSFGHRFLEVEHVALALLKADVLELSHGRTLPLINSLSVKLNEMQKVFGKVAIKFGQRLDKALDHAESQATEQPVNEKLLWDCLVAQSTILKNLVEGELLGGQNPANEKEGVYRNSQPHDSIQQNLQAEDPGVTEARSLDVQAKNVNIPEKHQKNLDKYTIDLTALAERGDLDPVVGRDLETRRVLEILGRKKKNNPILIGEAGVGKTAVAEAVALRIVERRVPETMVGKRVLSLDLGGVVAGARFRGEFEERMKNVLEAVKSCGGGVILFIDEIHMLAGAGSADGSVDAANLMKPALARGELRCLGATTLDEYREHIESDPALERRFQQVFVEEPSKEAALSILRGIKGRYEVHHGVQINDDALASAVDLSIRFLTNRKLPDKAIDLLDEACSRLRLQIDSVPSVMDKLRSNIEQMQIEKKTLNQDSTAQSSLKKLEVSLERAQREFSELEKTWTRHKSLLERLREFEGRKLELESLYQSTKSTGEFDFAAKLQYQELPNLATKIAEISSQLEKLQADNSWLRQVVGSIEIAQVIATWTRIPVSKILKDEVSKLMTIEQRMQEQVFGQNQAIHLIAQAIKRSRVGVNDPNRPIAVFLFLGPTGVGKTETAMVLASEIFDSHERIIRIDMSEYSQQHQVARLVGAPPGFVGYGAGGQLTDPVRHNPYSVILLDEIDKAHPRVLDILLQTIDDGRLTDGRGKLTDFRNTIIIMTSNIIISSPDGSMGDDAEEQKRRELAHYLRPEFVGRIDEVIIFKKLGLRQFELLLEKQLGQLNQRLAPRQFRIVLGDRLQQLLLSKVVEGHFGGRTLRRLFQSLVVDNVSERILLKPTLCLGAWQLEMEKDGVLKWSIDSSPHRYLTEAMPQKPNPT